MKHLAAYTLLVLAGKNPTADDVAKLLKEVGVASDKEELDQMFKALNGRKLHDLVNEGTKRLASVPSGGAAPQQQATSAPAGDVKKGDDKKEKPKEEEAADVDMGGLFGDDY